jgi:hypothetical protein
MMTSLDRALEFVAAVVLIVGWIVAYSVFA